MNREMWLGGSCWRVENDTCEGFELFPGPGISEEG